MHRVHPDGPNDLGIVIRFRRRVERVPRWREMNGRSSPGRASDPGKEWAGSFQKRSFDDTLSRKRCLVMATRRA